MWFRDMGCYSGFDHGGHGTAAIGSRVACGGSGRSGLTRRQRVASEIRLAAGGFDHGLHHDNTTSMVADPDLAPTRLDPGVTVFYS
jgi:hypothetical protein